MERVYESGWRWEVSEARVRRGYGEGCGRGAATGDWRLAIGDRRLVTGDWR